MRSVEKLQVRNPTPFPFTLEQDAKLIVVFENNIPSEKAQVPIEIF
jgi:hypothetical protein